MSFGKLWSAWKLVPYLYDSKYFLRTEVTIKKLMVIWQLIISFERDFVKVIGHKDGKFIPANF